MAIQVYINFNGNCREAVEYYAKVFGTEQPKIMLFGDAPPDPEFILKEEEKNLVMHTELVISGTNVMFSDTPSNMPLVVGNNFTLTVVTKDAQEITNAYNLLQVGGQITMALQETFWSKLFGSVIDQFGISWQFSLDSGEVY